MGILKNQILGDPSGKVGDKNYRAVGKDVIISQACTDFHKSESEASTAVRNRMVPMVAFCKAVNSFPELKAYWKKYKTSNPLSPFNKIQQYNARLFDQFNPTIKNKLIDRGNFDCKIESLILSNAGVYFEFSFQNLNRNIIPKIKSYSALYLISLYDPKVRGRNHFKVLSSRLELSDIPTDKHISIEIPFNDELSKIVDTYKKGIVYFVLVAKDHKDSNILISNNIAAEFEFSVSENPVRFPHPNGWTKIKLQISDYWMKNMKAERFILTQNYYKNESGNQIFEFDVKDPEDIVWWIMKLGKGVQVLEPVELRLKIIKLAADISLNYEIETENKELPRRSKE